MSAEHQVDWSKVEPTFKLTQAEGGAFARFEGFMPLSLVVRMMTIVSEYNARRSAASKSKRKTSGHQKRPR